MAKVYLNGNLVDEDKASLSIRDAGFLYGAGLFETMRSQSGTVFGLNDHLDRLCFSATKLGFQLSQNRESLQSAINQVLEANELRDARLRLTLTAGSLIPGQDKAEPTLLITATDLKRYPESVYTEGVLVMLCTHRQNSADPLSGHKTTNYFSRMLAWQAAKEKKAAEALWFTTEGYLAEGCVSNVFLVKDGALLTPAVETPVLAGVARKTICTLSVQENIELKEGPLTIDDLLEADEIFLTNIIMTVLPVVQMEKHTVGTGKVGPMTGRLLKAFTEEINRQCGERR